ncbi:MAG TPA: nitroreductase family protein [Sedimentisphaerales bacterium]|nr:nitroreductase family protein [Sedimentisphaerales bacterium]
MPIIESILARYSCRSYQDRPVEQDKLDEVLEAARLAPSAKNMQDWRFIVVTDKHTRHNLAKAAGDQMFLEKAGVIIVACSTTDYVMRCGQKIAPIDVAIALEHIALQAAHLNLATCWIGSFYPEKVKALLDIPDQAEIIELMAVGYPADKPKQPKRLSIDRICCYEKWSFD